LYRKLNTITPYTTQNRGLSG